MQYQVGKKVTYTEEGGSVLKGVIEGELFYGSLWLVKPATGGSACAVVPDNVREDRDV